MLLLLLLGCGVQPATAEVYQFSGSWGSLGSGQGSFNLPDGIGISSNGYVYVADYNNHRVQKFTSTGTPVGMWGSYGTGPGQFKYPQGLAVDGAGNVYVVDAANNRIQKFDANGGPIAQWDGKGVTGSGPKFFNGPVGVAVSNDGYVYVTDNGNQRIVKFTSTGTYAGEWVAFRVYLGGVGYIVPSPAGIAVDGAGNVYVVDRTNAASLVVKYTSTGTVITEWGNAVTVGSGDMFFYPFGVAVDSAGSVYVSDRDHIHTFSPSGTPGPVIGTFGTALGQLKFPRALTVNAVGTIYVADYDNNRVQLITRSPPLPTPTPTPVPVAAFSAAPLSGTAPLPVQFTDASTYSPTSWSWTFGDGATSTARHPSHTYTAAGTYTVTLRATNGGGSDDETKVGYITVTAPPPTLKTIPGGSGLPSDPGRDGKYDDVNGNGRPDFADVVLFFTQMSWIASNEPIAYFDCNANGRIDFADVTWLFAHL